MCTKTHARSSQASKYKKIKKFYLRTHSLSLVSVLCSGHSGIHLLFCTSRATLQALHPSDKSGLSVEVLQPAEEKTKHFSLYKCFTDCVSKSFYYDCAFKPYQLGDRSIYDISGRRDLFPCP